jgi:hypothetical protein
VRISGEKFQEPGGVSEGKKGDEREGIDGLL